MSQNHFEDLSAKLARDVDNNTLDSKVDASMLLRKELQQNPQEALALMQREMTREDQVGSQVRLNMNEKGEVFVTDFAPASGVHSESLYVGMYPGYPEPRAQGQGAPPCPPDRAAEARMQPQMPLAQQAAERAPLQEQPPMPQYQGEQRAPIYVQELPPPPGPPQIYSPGYQPAPYWGPQPTVSFFVGGGQGGWRPEHHYYHGRH
jgi:hypothetical protein